MSTTRPATQRQRVSTQTREVWLGKPSDEFDTFVIHNRQCGDALLHKNPQRCVERRVRAHHRYVLECSYVQLTDALAQKRGFRHLWYLTAEKQMEFKISKDTTAQLEKKCFQVLSCNGDSQKASGTWGFSCVWECKGCSLLRGRSQAACGSCSSAEMKPHRTNCYRKQEKVSRSLRTSAKTNTVMTILNITHLALGDMQTKGLNESWR